MMAEVKGAQLLQGFRGRPAADLEALADTLVRVAYLAMHLEGHLAELDINPLMVLPSGQGVKAVDALAVQLFKWHENFQPRKRPSGKWASLRVAPRADAARLGVLVHLSLETASPCVSRYLRWRKLAQPRLSASALSMQRLWAFEIPPSFC